MRFAWVLLLILGCAKRTTSGVERCDNGVDDDGDGFVDCADPSCFGASECFGTCAPACSVDQLCSGGACVDPGDLDGGSDAGATHAGADAGSDGGVVPDAGATDAGADAGPGDAGQPPDAGGLPDAGADAGLGDAGAPDAGGRDAGYDAGQGSPDAGPTHVHIFISNTCQTSTSPSSINASLSTGVMLQFHNHSADYQADVWSSRNYGYLELPLGAVWNDPIQHCRGPNPFTEYFDVSIAGGGTSACPSVRFTMHCQ